jgi:hypothetical protein
MAAFQYLDISQQQANKEVEAQARVLRQLKQEYDRVKILLDQTQSVRSKRAKNPTRLK